MADSNEIIVHDFENGEPIFVSGIPLYEECIPVRYVRANIADEDKRQSWICFWRRRRDKHYDFPKIAYIVTGLGTQPGTSPRGTSGEGADEAHLPAAPIALRKSPVAACGDAIIIGSSCRAWVLSGRIQRATSARSRTRHRQ